MTSTLAVLAGSVSTVVFIASYLPMLSKAARTHDLASYSAGNLVLANVGNAVYSIYVFSLPAGPIWALHSFYLLSSLAMLAMWVRYRRGVARSGQESSSRRTVGGATVRNASRQTAVSSPVLTSVSSTPSQPRWPTYGGRKNRSGSVSTISA
jgi:uncharacterized protein with PQ loop repeat